MKAFSLLLIVATLILSCNDAPKTTASSDSTAPKNTDLVQQHLNGRVKSVTETSYQVDSTGKTGKMDSIITVNELDEKGYTSKYYQKDSSGKILMEQTISHYDNGLLKEVTALKNGKPDFKLTTDIEGDHFTGGKTYDSTGKQDSYYKDVKVNEYGMVYAGKRYTMNDKFKESWDQKVEGSNNLGGTYIDSTGKPAMENTIKVNDKGWAVEEMTMTREKDSTKTEKKTYQYKSLDEKGNWTEQTTYNDKGNPVKVTRRTYTYYKD
jgi:hypothetical protein